MKEMIGRISFFRSKNKKKESLNDNVKFIKFKKTVDNSIVRSTNPKTPCHTTKQSTLKVQVMEVQVVLHSTKYQKNQSLDSLLELGVSWTPFNQVFLFKTNFQFLKVM
jgi:hypothetical protein